MIERGWLRIEPKEPGYTSDMYYIYFRDEWGLYQPFTWFKPSYGVDVCDIERRGDRLFSKKDGTPVLLISGRPNRIAPEMYESASLKMYEEMLRLQKTREPDDELPSGSAIADREDRDGQSSPESN